MPIINDFLQSTNIYSSQTVGPEFYWGTSNLMGRCEDKVSHQKRIQDKSGVLKPESQVIDNFIEIQNLKESALSDRDTDGLLCGFLNCAQQTLKSPKNTFFPNHEIFFNYYFQIIDSSFLSSNVYKLNPCMESLYCFSDPMDPKIIFSDPSQQTQQHPLLMFMTCNHAKVHISSGNRGWRKIFMETGLIQERLKNNLDHLAMDTHHEFYDFEVVEHLNLNPYEELPVALLSFRGVDEP